MASISPAVALIFGTVGLILLNAFGLMTFGVAAASYYKAQTLKATQVHEIAIYHTVGVVAVVLGLIAFGFSIWLLVEFFRRKKPAVHKHF